jgi:hypothetical protein
VLDEELIVTVDPGGTTGYACASIRGEEALLPPVHGQLPPQEFCAWLEGVAGSWGERLTIVVEKFTISQRTLRVSRGGSYDAIEVTGVCRYLSRRTCHRDIETQQPAEVMRLFPDSWLRDHGWYVTGQGHANDALRHLALYLAKRKLIRVAG